MMPLPRVSRPCLPRIGAPIDPCLTISQYHLPSNEVRFEYRESGALDFLSLGALVHRLDPGPIPFRKATHCDIHVSGGEFNCAANLADCFGLNTASPPRWSTTRSATSSPSG